MRRIAPLVMVLLAGGLATAQPKSESTRLFEEGRVLAKAGKYAEACEAFGKSIALDRAPGTALNYGDCLEKIGQLRMAWQMFDEAAREFDKLKDSRGKFARERADGVTPKLGTLTIKVAEPALPGLVVKIGNESVPVSAQIVERYEPGTVEVSVSAPGHTPFSSSARATAGANVIVDIPALAASDGGTGPTPVVPGGETRRNPGRVKLSLGLGAAGGVALIAGGILTLSARSKYNGALDDMKCIEMDGKLVCTEEGASEVNSAATRANIATGLVVGGGVLAAAALILFVTAPRESLTVGPMASTSTVGLSVGRSF